MSTAHAARLDDIQNEEARLSKLIDERTKRVMTLSEESERLRQEVATSYRKKFEPKFKDLDVIQALAGYPAQHTIRVFGVGYVLRPPAQSVVHDVEKFATNPVADGQNYGPLRGEELTLLGWLISVRTDNGAESDLSKVTYAMKLNAIRKLPEVLLGRLAEECLNMNTYLNICLEQELGKS